MHPILLIGRPGVGKSETWERALEEAVPGRTKTVIDYNNLDWDGEPVEYEIDVPGYGWINNTASAFGAYKLLYEYADCPFVIDDIHSLDKDLALISLLKTVTNTKPTKRVTWTSNITRRLRDVPPEFDTTSPVAMISNSWSADNAFAKALEDRAKCYEFRPTAHEIHNYVATWFKDQEAFDWIADRLPVLPDLSVRDYEKVRDLRLTGMRGWETDAAQQIGADPVNAEMVRVLRDDTLIQQKDKQREWTKKTGLGRSQFFDYKGKIEEALGGNLETIPKGLNLPIAIRRTIPRTRSHGWPGHDERLSRCRRSGRSTTNCGPRLDPSSTNGTRRRRRSAGPAPTRGGFSTASSM